MNAVKSIEPQWFLGYANDPTIIVNLTELGSKELKEADWLWGSYPDPDARAKTMLISKNVYPWVKFKYIDNPKGNPTYDGNYGGEHVMLDSTIFKSRTGWSSRAGVINKSYRDYLLDEIVEVIVHFHDQSIMMAGYAMYVTELKSLVEAEGFYLVRKIKYDEPTWTISTEPDKVVKADAQDTKR